ncbi:MAG TPA: adenosylcobinamide-GDP ribazoletransferase [Cyanobacteria bacterium UBA11149]|nr:adenosylcobinamide-GDP ribazoletransferase [Cyanobacteria bacterium UBA11367]HBE58538.1 adenosylcobinamide-GDP ribazoletransferase [Cyanobacteria bacterium UBA11366]HBK62133.1 adenosylcobinamide-GDP ribazoletransferase [Cyanobacteria bacterium UBA11166]HBR72245.1 adenosylcobinamide-GDP ribazoletransferase [Cyanobacteria bacterium UBA11159]HBS72016.1 adenosylcobinamide-GDP ribazoletransferase [Cyanobacteria bacterium UBA11153]HBW91690.1 adenosylcobinamide-GDP ribazoletransferase [Cyanobacter
MRYLRMRGLLKQGSLEWFSWLGAIAFYTCIPIPACWGAEFRRIARWAPLVGLLIGAILGLVDLGLQQLGVPLLTRSVGIVAIWIGVTGGLHLDGAMDTADGLAVGNPQRRLEVMTDSATGAFGAMTAVVLLLLKVAALTDIEEYRWLVLMGAAGWGRWGQVAAIAFYPYLKPTGKGAFHKESISLPQDILGGWLLLLGISGLPLLLDRANWSIALVMAVGGFAIALFTGNWFYRQLGGHTGDTYGAVVEWTEALFVCLLTPLLD